MVSNTATDNNIFIKEDDEIQRVQRGEQHEVFELRRDGAIEMVRGEVPEKATMNENPQRSIMGSIEREASQTTRQSMLLWITIGEEELTALAAE